MAESIGRGVIELSADASKLTAGINEAKRSLKDLGVSAQNATRGQSASIDRYVRSLHIQNQTLGLSARQSELLRLELRGASGEQLRSADAALRFAEANKRNAQQMEALRTSAARLGAIIGTVLVTGLIAAAAAFDNLVKKAGNFQDLAEKTGDTAENLASLSVAAAIGGKSMDEVADFAIKLAKNLTGVDDEGEKAGAALKSIGIEIEKFKGLSATEQLQELARALAQFDDKGGGKTTVLEALGRGGAALLPMLKELEGGVGRVNILTAEQIRLADEYSDKQAKTRAQLSLYAQAIATDMIPVLGEFTRGFAELIEQTFGFGRASAEAGEKTAGLAVATEVLRGALSGVTVVFQTIAVVASDVGFVFLGVGREIGAIAAQLAALARLDFSGFRAISEAVKEDAARARAALDKFQADVLKLGQPNAFGNARSGSSSSATPPQKPRINFGGAVKKPGAGSADNSAEQEAKAQLAFDLDQIKKAGDAQIQEFDRAQRILESRRSAALVDDQAYFASKLGFINLNLQAQSKAIEAEIALLEKQVFTGKNAGKEKIDNDRKIADATARLSKVRADAVAEIEINSIQEAAANERVRQSYLDALEAANAYIDGIRRRNAAEVAGIGAGNKAREQLAGQIEIEQRFLEQRRRLEAELRRGQITRDVFETYLQLATQAYEQEVQLYQERTIAIQRAESDWLIGAREALNNYADETSNVAKRTEEVFTNAFRGAEDALTEFLDTGKLDVKSFVKQITSDLNRSFVQQNITGPLSAMLKEQLEGGGGILSGLLGAVGLGKGGGSAVKVVEGTIAKEGLEAANAAQFGAAIAASGAQFSATVAPVGATLATTLTTAGTAFSASVAAAGSAFAAQVAASSAASSAGSSAGGLLNLADFAFDSFAGGTPFVPQTGLALVHKGERIVSADDNAKGGGGQTFVFNQQFAPGTNRAIIDHAAIAMGREIQRQNRRGTSA